MVGDNYLYYNYQSNSKWWDGPDQATYYIIEYSGVVPTTVTTIQKSLAATVASDFTEDKVLYADASLIAHTAGVGTVSWQWQRSGDGGATWVDISGATSSSYTLVDGDAGKLVRTKGSYTDGQGTDESMASAATSVIANVNDAATGTVTVSGRAGAWALFSLSLPPPLPPLLGAPRAASIATEQQA